jgi:DNA-binding transcriptional ArsR family regulator
VSPKSPETRTTEQPAGVTGPDGAALTSLFCQLSDRTRLRLLLLLGGGERSVQGLERATGLPQPTVSHHLGLLRAGKLVVADRRGKQVFYRLSEAVREMRPLTISAGDATVSIRFGSSAGTLDEAA